MAKTTTRYRLDDVFEPFSSQDERISSKDPWSVELSVRRRAAEPPITFPSSLVKAECILVVELKYRLDMKSTAESKIALRS